MKVVRITDLDYLSEFPVGYILKSQGAEEMVGCCPKAFLNFFGLLGVINDYNSSFLFWLKGELRENNESLITPKLGLVDFVKNPIFETIECKGGLIYDFSSIDFLTLLLDEWVLLTFLLSNGRNKPCHCEVYYFKNGRIYCNGTEITGKTFVQKLYCDELNNFIVGRKKQD